MVLAAPLTVSERGEPKQKYRFELVSVAPLPEPERPLTAREVYQVEKAKREERRKANPQMTEAQQAFAALQERERERGRGGRPKGSKNSGAFKIPKAGKPMIVAVKNDPLDLSPYVSDFYGVGR